MRILGKFENYNYVHYNYCVRLKYYYDEMYNIVKNNGHALMANNWSLDAGILLENQKDVIAGAFYNTTKNSNSILIHIVFVKEEYRRRGIYSALHKFIDNLGKEDNRSNVYSYIHANNNIMNEYICKKIGYSPVMHLVKREIL